MTTFEQLVKENMADLRIALSRFVTYAIDIDDLIQETLLKAFLNFDKYDQIRPFGAWLCWIGRNVARDHYRRTQQVKRIKTQPFVCEPMAVDPRKQMEFKEELAATLNDLPAKYRDTLQSIYLTHDTIAAVAQSTGLALASVRWRLMTAKQLFHAAYRDRLNKF